MSFLSLAAIFVAAGAAIWAAGIQLSKATDALDARLHLGSALGGLLLLAVATNLPEVAITATAAISGHLALAVGNLVGGIAIQTLVLALLDARTKNRPLTHMAGSLIVVLEASIVIGVLVVAIMTTQLPASTEIAGVSPGSLMLVVLWLAGLLAVDRARKGIAWQIHAPGAASGRSAVERSQGAPPQPFQTRTTAFIAGVFAAAALLTLAAGIAIERSGSQLADRVGLTGAVFGATILAASTALPEISTGLASVALGDHGLAFADIFGGNAFLPVLFILADLLSGSPALPTAQASDIWMAGLGVVLTVIYIGGLIIRPKRKLGPIGPDSWIAVALYALGIIGLLIIG